MSKSRKAFSAYKHKVTISKTRFMAELKISLVIVLLMLNLMAAPLLKAAALIQSNTATFSLTNDSKQTICIVQTAFSIADTWSPNHLGEAKTIGPGQTLRFNLTPGEYDLRLLDCTGNIILLERNLTIATAYARHFTDSDYCDSLLQHEMFYDSQTPYIEALKQLEVVRTCYHEIGDRAGEALSFDNIGFIYAYHQLYDEALEQYQQALAIQQEIGDRAGEAVDLYEIGGIYYALHRYDEALIYFQQALAIQQEIGDWAGEGRSLSNIGSIYDVRGQSDQASDYYQQALSLVKKFGNPRDVAIVLNNIGSIYANSAQYNKALDYYQQTLSILQEIGDQASEATGLTNIGVIYYRLGQYTQALDYQRQALNIRQKIGDRARIGRSLGQIAAIYYELGQYEQALNHYRQALSIQQEMGDRGGEGRSLNGIGIIYHSLGQYDRALDYYKQVSSILQKIGDREGESTILNNIGGIHDSLGQYDQALDYYRQALSIQQEIGDQMGEAASLNNIGDIYGSLGRNDLALDYHQQALNIRRAIGDRAGEGGSLANIGNIYHKRGLYDQALDYFTQAFSIQQEIGDRRGEGNSLSNIADLDESLGLYDQALAHFKQAIEKVEAIRAEAGTEQDRAKFIAQFASLYNRMIELLMRQEKGREAFLVTERGRARSFLDSLSTGQVQLSDETATALLSQERDVYARRQQIYLELLEAHSRSPSDQAWIDQLKVQLARADADHAKIQDEITAYSDQLADLIPGRSKNLLGVPELQTYLGEHTTLISYWMLDDTTWAFVVTADNFTVVELPDAQAETLRNILRNLYTWPNRDNAHPRPLRNLYGWLVAPLVEYISTPHVFIVPHQLLHYVPFAALTNGEHYFGQQHTLSILPSASALPFLLQNEQQSEQNSASQALVFGNPTTNEPELQPLVYAAGEAQAIAQLLATQVYTGAAASETQLLTSVARARIVHLAAHGGYNTANPLYSLIALAPSGKDDGRLETHEIFGLSLGGNDLVVLSACQTNVGELSGGDELVGLTRAFFFAGSPTVISSLWSVDDAATEKLMVSFYKHWLQDGMSKATALQAAQADVRTDPRWVSPFYWAGFVLNGHPGVSK